MHGPQFLALRKKLKSQRTSKWDYEKLTSGSLQCDQFSQTKNEGGWCKWKPKQCLPKLESYNFVGS